METVAMALLYPPSRDRFLLQLRDDFPHILYPGYWGLFGGHLEPGELPEQGLRRELVEEIGFEPPQLELFRIDHAETDRERYFFHGLLTIELDQLQLNEGQDMAWGSIPELQAGERWSPRLQETRPIGPPHRSVLLALEESLSLQSR
jgi:8-oxo-dGTP pyrophosphatase MutT (NUDIX family)